MRRAALLCCVVLIAGAGALRPPPAGAASSPSNGDFEGGAAGWAPADGGTFTIGAEQPVNGGAAAGHLQSSASGTVTVRTQYWLTPAVPGRRYSLSIAVRIPAATMSAVTARIDLVDDSGVALASNAATRAGPTTGYVTITAAPVTAPPGTQYALVVVSGAATAAGARLSIDDVAIAETLPPAPAAPAAPPEDDSGSDAPAAPAPTPARSTPTATPVRVSTPVAQRTPPPQRTPTVPRPAALAGRMTNTSFDSNLNGWTVVEGRAWTEEWIPGAGPSMVLHTPGAGLAWAEQAVGDVRPGTWYQASALLSTKGNVTAGWVRVTWHTSGGSALSTEDSLAVDAHTDGAATPRYQVVGTGAIQAPPTAASATVRLLLLSTEDGSGAWLLIDDVSFGVIDAPEQAAGPPRTPREAQAPHPDLPPEVGAGAIVPGAFQSAAEAPGSATPGSARAGSAPRPTGAPTAAAGGTPGLTAESVVAPGVAEAQRVLRITQVLPDPEMPGIDAEYEWVEVGNFGTTAASVEGMTLRDNSGSVTLPALVIPAGGSLVITARLAEVPGVAAFRVPLAIGNGLGNSGDRLVLVGTDGRQVDAFSYGDDTTYLGGARIPAPGTGRAIERRFAPDGSYREAVIVDHPVPGRGRAATATATPQVAAPREGASGMTGAAGTWVALLSLGAGLLGGVAAQRMSAFAASRRSG
ncbi:MAG: lamin tail domain-containing protein [Dehalococcoidia bacterium]